MKVSACWKHCSLMRLASFRMSSSTSLANVCRFLSVSSSRVCSILIHSTLSLSRSLCCSSGAQRIRTRHCDHHCGVSSSRFCTMSAHSCDMPSCSCLHFFLVAFHSGIPTCTCIFGMPDFAPRCRHAWLPSSLRPS